MSKAILISIKPQFVAEILNHRKTIELRKTAPKCDLPIDVYIYCTKSKYGELRKSVLDGWYINSPLDHPFNGKVVAKFRLRKVEKLEYYRGAFTSVKAILTTDSIPTCYLMEKKSCLTMDEMWEYTKGNGYAWHISDLEIFDEPKPLTDFKGGKIFGDKPPQSWKYVEVEE